MYNTERNYCVIDFVQVPIEYRYSLRSKTCSSNSVAWIGCRGQRICTLGECTGQEGVYVCSIITTGACS
jgi:hypothetical protein